MRQVSFVIAFLVIVLIIGGFFYLRKEKIISPLGKAPKEKPLEKYTFENLRKTSFPASVITLGKESVKDDSFIAQTFYFSVQNSGKIYKVSGDLHVPTKSGTYPVIVMNRGFVPKESFVTGIGTKRAAEVFSTNGFITLAPDFLGYGESDNPSNSSIEERFQTYMTTLTLLSSLKNLNEGLSASYSGEIKADVARIGLWGHSNGGHIALSILSITGKNYPTVLWAPVGKPFPYSILYFTDEFDDNGKALRKVVADFEDDYDIEKYSPTNYYHWIQAPLQIHQGDADDAVPIRWSNQLVTTLKNFDKDVEYFLYPGADHNLLGGWSLAVGRSMEFYKKHLQ